MTPYEKLQRLHRGPTRYEITATDGTRTLLIGYTAGKSRHLMLEMMRKNGPGIVAGLGLDVEDLMTFGRGAYDGCTVGRWKVRYSGRTQREAVSCGEYAPAWDAGIVEATHAMVVEAMAAGHTGDEIVAAAHAVVEWEIQAVAS